MKRVTLFSLFVVVMIVFAVMVPNSQVFGAGSYQAQSGTLTAGSGTGIPATGIFDASTAFVRLSSMNNYAIRDLSGNQIGTVNDYVINLVKSRVDYIVATVNGRTVLLPWASLTSINAQDQAFVFKDNVSRLQNAPDFNVNNVDFGNEFWSQSVLNYWRFGGGLNNNNNQNNQGTPVASGTEQATAAAGSTGSSSSSSNSGTTGNNQGSSQTGNVNSSNRVAILASQLLGQQIYNLNTVNSTGVSTAQSGSQSVPQTGSSSSSGTSATPQATSSAGSSGSVSSTPEATSSAGTAGGVSATSQAATSSGTTSSTSSTPQPTSTAGGTSSTVNQGNNANTSGSDVIGTVADFVITRINGNIRYVLVNPAFDLGNNQQVTFGGLLNGSTASSGSVPQTGGTNQNQSSTPVAESTLAPQAITVVATTPMATEVVSTAIATEVVSTAAATEVVSTVAATEVVNTPMATATVETSTGTSTGSGVSGTSVATSTVNNSGNNSNGNTSPIAAGSQLVPVPMSVISRSFNSSNNQVVLRMSPFMLQNAPVINASTFPNAFGFGWDVGVQNYWISGWQNFLGRVGNQGILTTGGTPQPSATATATP